VSENPLAPPRLRFPTDASELVDRIWPASATRTDDGTYRYGVHHFRYVWPAEADLMARLAALEPESRHADWTGTPFTGDSGSHVSVWRKPA